MLPQTLVNIFKFWNFELKKFLFKWWSLSLLGVGVGMVMVSAIVCVYYNVIVAWTLYFLYMSFRAVLPWSTCDNEWNTVNCVVDTGDRLPQPSPPTNATNSSSLFNSTYLVNGTLFNQTVFGNMSAALSAAGNATAVLSGKKMSASEEFWTWV